MLSFDLEVYAYHHQGGDIDHHSLVGVGNDKGIRQLEDKRNLFGIE
jgi:hypothetical protein